MDRGVAISTTQRGVESVDRASLFRTLVERDLNASYRLARAILGDAAAAEDAVHDAFVTAWLKLATLRDAERLEPWFHRILVNTCRDRLRRTTRWPAVDIAERPDACVGDATADVDDRDTVGRAIAGLSPDHRIVLALRYYRDLTVDDIALDPRRSRRAR